MIPEAHTIAARLAAASEVFPIRKVDDWDSTARVTADGDTITITVHTPYMETFGGAG